MEIGEAFRQPLYDVFGSPAVSMLTAAASPAPGPGPIINIPDFSYGVYAPGNIPPGEYNIGVACTQGPASATQMKNFYNVTKTFAVSPTGGPAQVTWDLTAPTTSSTAGPTTSTIVAPTTTAAPTTTTTVAQPTTTTVAPTTTTTVAQTTTTTVAQTTTTTAPTTTTTVAQPTTTTVAPTTTTTVVPTTSTTVAVAATMPICRVLQSVVARIPFLGPLFAALRGLFGC